MLAAIAGGGLEGSPSTAVPSPLPLRSVWLYATSATIPWTAPKIGILGRRHHRRACLDMVAFTSGLPSVHHLDLSLRAGSGRLGTTVRGQAASGFPSWSRARPDHAQRGDALRGDRTRHPRRDPPGPHHLPV